jgi:Rad3-related DNA helicase
MDLPDLNLGDKFRDWRRGQLDLIVKCVQSGKRFIGLPLPTGSGKTLIAVALAKLLAEEHDSVILTATKSLQDQISRDFRGVFTMKGRDNYPCELLDNKDHCGNGPCVEGEPCAYITGGCSYFDSLRMAQASITVNTNYAYYLASEHYSVGIGRRSLVICDEAHELRNWILNFLTVRLSVRRFNDLNWLCRWTRPRTPAGWREWAYKAMVKLEQVKSEKQSCIKHLRKLKPTLQIMTFINNEWFVKWDDREGLECGPVDVESYAPMLWGNAKKVVLMSATLTRQTMALLGIRDYDWIEADSRFPRRNRPFIWIPTNTISHRMSKGEWRDVIYRMDNIVRPRVDAGRKGVIHTVSYSRMMEVHRLSEHRSRMIIHEPGGQIDAIREFKESTDGAILVSPSVGTGIDFPDDECRWQIAVKVPFPDSRDPYYQAQQKATKGIGVHHARIQLIQQYGRGVRSCADWCEFFILDDSVRWVIFKEKKLFPRWFREAWQTKQTIPPLMRAVSLPESA